MAGTPCCCVGRGTTASARGRTDADRTIIQRLDSLQPVVAGVPGRGASDHARAAWTWPCRNTPSQAFPFRGTVRQLALPWQSCTVALPVALNHLPPSGVTGVVLEVARWPTLLVLVAFGLTLIYRY